MATGSLGNWGGRDFVASEVGGGEDGKGRGTIHPGLVRSDQGCVGPLSASSFFFSLSYPFIHLLRQGTGEFVHVNITTTDQHRSLTFISHFCWPRITNIT